jgi:hypothetical protein
MQQSDLMTGLPQSLNRLANQNGRPRGRIQVNTDALNGVGYAPSSTHIVICG